MCVCPSVCLLLPSLFFRFVSIVGCSGGSGVCALRSARRLLLDVTKNRDRVVEISLSSGFLSGVVLKLSLMEEKINKNGLYLIFLKLRADRFQGRVEKGVRIFMLYF